MSSAPHRSAAIILVMGALGVASLTFAADEPEHHRIVSAHLAEVLAAARPAFKPPAEATVTPTPPPENSLPPRANDIVRLPQMVVREPKLPNETEVLTPKGLAEREMKHYFGPRDGLDRGVLNAVTVAGLWKKIPILGQLLGCPIPSMTNEERAMMYYREDERIRQMSEFGELLRLTRASGDSTSADKIKKEATDTFIRKE
jgi:hypothetical protein